MNYITREGGATVTVFVPWNCTNNCPFCINKADYEKQDNFNFEEVEKSIKIMSIMTPNCDFVFTGGEPLIKPDLLQKLLHAVHQKGTNHKVFINTTLPTNEHLTEDKMARILNGWYHNTLITGINVSRHLRNYVQECDDKIFSMLNFKVRINCVISFFELEFGIDKLLKKLKDFVKRFKNITDYIQFRADYVTTTIENLYVEYDENNPIISNDKIFTLLCKAFKFINIYGAYRMRVGYEFDANGYKVTYHRTLPYSKIRIDNDNSVLYDIIIKPNGDIKEDWDTCTEEETRKNKNRKCNNLALDLDLNAYRKVTYEEYK